MSQNSAVVSVQNKNMEEGSCVNPRSAERIFALLATMFGDQQHETLEEYIAAALILHVTVIATYLNLFSIAIILAARSYL